MNSINSSGITASSILSGNMDLKPAGDVKKSDSASIPTEDVLVKSEKEDVSLKDKLFKLSSDKNPFKKLTEQDKEYAVKGAVIGGVAGGVIGGIAAYNMSQNEIKATNDIQSVTLDWQEPVIKSENLGKIPASYYQHAGWWLNSGSQGFKDVYENNPVLENGKPVMQDVQKTYSDYGEPVVTWKDNKIVHKTLTGFSERVVTDTSTYREYEGTDSDGNAIYSTHTEVDGFWHYFSPDIHNTVVGNYQTPQVKFETGVNVGLNTALGVLAGAGIGALAGGVAGAAISHVMNKEEVK